MSAPPTAKQREAIAKCYERGLYTWDLRDYQRKMVEDFEKTAARVFFSCCSRRVGKTSTAVRRSAKRAARGKRVRYCFPTLLQAEAVIVPMMESILGDCPQRYRPKFSAKHLMWEWPSGGSVRLGGADTRRAANRLRGDGADDFVLDEACFYDEYEYVVNDVAMPQLFTSDGRMWLLSTPSDNYGHPSRMTYEKCRAAGAYAHYDIWITLPFYGEKRIREFLDEAGGETSTTAIREYFARFTPDTLRAIVPEFVLHEEHIVRELERPKYCFRYTVGDFGFNDLTFVLFLYYDFERALIVVEDELVCERESSMVVADKVLAKEAEIWPGLDEPTRIADADLQVLADMNGHNGCLFVPPEKEDAAAALNAVRMAVHKHRLAIHPRCLQLIAHLRAGIWNSARTDWARVEGFGHFDGIAALQYGVRHADQQTNPFPALADGVSWDTHWIDPRILREQHGHDVRAAFVR